MIRLLLRALLGVLVLLLGATASHVDAAMLAALPVMTCAYDNNPDSPMDHAGARYDHGSPLAADGVQHKQADDDRRFGTSARPGSTATTTIHDYDGHSQLAQLDRVAGYTASDRQLRISEPARLLSSLRLSGVAAKTTPQVLKGPAADAVPQSLPQQLALGAAREGHGTRIMGNLADEPRLVAHYGNGDWVKMQYVLRGNDTNVTVHYFRNLTTKMDVEFKFK